MGLYTTAASGTSGEKPNATLNRQRIAHLYIVYAAQYVNILWPQQLKSKPAKVKFYQSFDVSDTLIGRQRR